MAKKTPHLSVSKTEKNRRIHLVFEMIIESKSTASIINFCQEEWDILPETVYRYIGLANKIMAKYLEGERDTSIKKAIHQREHIIEKLMDSKQYAMAQQALADKNKLEGLYEQNNVDATVNIKVIQK